MAQESLQKKEGRVRPPRVHITYDVETGGAIEKRELPFVVGVLADLSGKPDTRPMKERKFVPIDRDSFDTVLKKIQPTLAFKVKNTLEDDDTNLGVNLVFNKLDDFRPAKVAEQIEPLRKMLDLRKSLANLRSSLIGNDKLEGLLQEMIQNHDKLQEAGAEAGLDIEEKEK